MVLTDFLDARNGASHGNGNVKLELDHRERRAVHRSLADRKTLLVEIVQDTTRSHNTRRAGMIEAETIDSVLRKLRVAGEAGVHEQGCGGKNPLRPDIAEQEDDLPESALSETGKVR
jgi:hypothetical protein